MSAESMRIEPAPEKGFFDNILPRQVEPSGLIGWLTTIDHKRIGILYLVTSLFWFLVGGLEAVMIRIQLHRPEMQGFIDADTYNALFTMHGTTMIFLVIMPMAVAFFNYIMPLQIGARDVAFPRMNAFSYWMFLGGSVLMNLSWFVDAAPKMAWVGYAPLTNTTYTPGMEGEFWIVGLTLLGVSSLIGALNFVTTVINMRAPGMTFMRMPVFTWMTLITGLLLIMALPAITIALVELAFDRLFATNFFEAAAGGLPILWQHLFWVFGHPEVYILILPPMGMISEILPVFSRKPLFGYPLIVGSGAAIGFMGFTVWSHHMFTSGMGNIANAAFALTTMAIAVPTGVKIFNWIGTLYNGQLVMKTPMLFALGFIYQFMMGGFSGLMHANAAHDVQQHDSYFIVAHFHYVLIGGALFGSIAGIYYWFPKVTGKILDEKMGKAMFWFLFIGFNLTFFPMHWLGLNGMPRRIYTYAARNDWGTLNLVCTLGAVLMAIAVIIFYIDLYRTIKGGKPAGDDPWNARTTEWSIPSPPPVYNFKETPLVKTLDDFWYQKYPESLHSDEEHGLDATDSPYEDEEYSMHPSDYVEHHHHDEHGIHMPGRSWFPMIAAFGFCLGGLGIVLHRELGYSPEFLAEYEVPYLQILFKQFWLGMVGGLIGVLGIFAWAMEPIGGYNIHFDDEKEESSTPEAVEDESVSDEESQDGDEAESEVEAESEEEAEPEEEAESEEEADSEDESDSDDQESDEKKEDK